MRAVLLIAGWVMLACVPTRPLDLRADSSRWEPGRRDPGRVVSTRNGVALPRLIPRRGHSRPEGAAPVALAPTFHLDLGDTLVSPHVSPVPDVRVPVDRSRVRHRSRAPPSLQS